MSPWDSTRGFALADTEKATNQILACRAIPQTDVTVAWLDGEDAIPAHPVVRQRALVVAIESLTHDIRRIRLSLEDREGFGFQPGQYIRLAVKNAPPRDYSLASLPDDRHIELHVRAVPGGRTSSRIVTGLRVGEIVRVEGPFGSAFLRKGHKGPIIAVAGGSGLAPIKSIVESALIADPQREAHVYFGARSPRDVYLADHFRGIAMDLPNVAYNAVLSKVAAPGCERDMFLMQSPRITSALWVRRSMPPGRRPWWKPCGPRCKPWVSKPPIFTPMCSSRRRAMMQK